MKISKIFAGMSALAIAATMAISASASTSIAITDGQTEDWASAFAKNGEGDDFIDAKSLTKDTALDVKVDFTWTESGTTNGYVLLKPAYANGWNAFSKTEGYVSGLTLKTATTGTADETSHKYVDADGNEYDYVLQDDGFIVSSLPECNSFEFTLSADCVNALIENANKDEDAFDGIIFQISGLQVTNVELSQDNVKLNSQMATGDDSSSATDTSSTGDSSSKADTSSSSSSSAASSSSKSGSTTSTKAGSTSTAAAATSSKASDNTNAATGATAGIALAGLALAGAAVVVAKRK